MAELGTTWFSTIFRTTTDSSKVWNEARELVKDLRIVVEDTTPQERSLFWELLREPDGLPFAIAARSFVRIGAQDPHASSESLENHLRILIVIARPHLGQDVGVRSVAGSLVRALKVNPNVTFEVLRPPTLDALTASLTSAALKGTPWDVVHFDGHGVWKDLESEATGKPARRPRGYVYFETEDGSADPVDGSMLGRILVDSGVRVLFLNACRSAHVAAPAPAESANPSSHALMRSVGSFISHVYAAGVQSVIGMRYDVAVDSASRLTATIYKHIVAGSTVGAAVGEARRDLYANSRWLAKAPFHVGATDWALPAVYETKPIQLLAPNAQTTADRLSEQIGPLAGEALVGGDRLLDALDRATRKTACVLLTGMVGSGKTAAAADFATWWTATSPDGTCTWVDGSRPFGATMSFDHLDASALVVIDALDRNRSDSVASEIHRIAATGAHVLVTSRRTEKHRLPTAKADLSTTPLTMVERFQLGVMVSGLQRLSEWRDIQPWLDLMDSSQGNPQAVQLLVSTVLQRGVDASDAAPFSGFPWANPLLRTWELDPELRTAADELAGCGKPDKIRLMALFQGILNIDVLRTMGSADFLRPFPPVNGLSRDDWQSVMERVSDAGLASDRGSGYFEVHPFLPAMCAKTLGPPDSAALESWVWSMAGFGEHYANCHRSQKGWLPVLRAERRNLDTARRVATAHGWWTAVASAVVGLKPVLNTPLHRQQWQELVTSLVPIAFEPGGTVRSDRKELAEVVEECLLFK